MDVCKDSEQYGTKEVQLRLLKMLQMFDAFCNENGIKYSLGCGSLLGAVRHGGFIPWDNDIDILVDRENYEKLKQCWKDSHDYAMTRKLWIYRIQQFDHGTPLEDTIIDLFIADSCPAGLLFWKWKVLCVRLLQGMMHTHLEFTGKTLFQRFLLFSTYCLGRLFSDESKYRAFDRVSQWGNGKPSRGINTFNDVFRLTAAVYDEDLFDRIELHPFEDLELPIIHKWDHYLTLHYGDYMTPPPADQRIVLPPL